MRLAHRFFAGHGPASIKDFTRWASLTVTDATAAVDALGDALEQVEVEGVPQWFDPTVPRRTTAGRAAYLLPVYDEAALTYPTTSFPAAPGHPNGEHIDPFWAPVIVDGTNAGLWKRSIAKGTVAVEAYLAASLDHEQRCLVRAAAQRLADFLERDLDYTQREGTPALWRAGRGGCPTRPRRGAAALSARGSTA